MNIRGYVYQDGIRMIELAYRESALGIKHAFESAESTMAEATKAGRSDLMAAFPLEHIAEIKMQQTAAAWQVMMQSYAVALYHYWERAVMEWQGVKGGGRFASPPYAWLRSQGLSVDEEKLEDMRYLVKLIKHDKGTEIEQRRPDMFPTGESGIDALILVEYMMNEFFTAVRGSGFQYKPDISSWTGAKAPQEANS